MDNELILSTENSTEMEITGVSMKGDKGDPGYTPQKGVDYFTEEDIESLGLSAKEDVANKVETLSYDESYGEKYPTADAVLDYGAKLYNLIIERELAEHKATVIDAYSSDVYYPTTKAVWNLVNLNYKEYGTDVTAGSIAYTPTISGTTFVFNAKPLASLNISIVPDGKYHAYIIFRSGETPTTLTYARSGIKWVGVDCDADGDFIPSKNTYYEISLSYSGAFSPEIQTVARVGVF